MIKHSSGFLFFLSPRYFVLFPVDTVVSFSMLGLLADEAYLDNVFS